MLTPHLEENVNVGDIVNVRGPFGKWKYEGFGHFQYMKRPIDNIKKRVGFIAAGSGFTTLYQMALASVQAQDGLDITFLYSNKMKGDILYHK